MRRYHTHVARPTDISALELDAYLEAGWYRIGQTMMTCRFLLFDGTLRSTMWTRLPLQDHVFRKGQRKLLSRVRRGFSVQTGPAALDHAHEALYQRYLSLVSGDRSPTLAYFLFESSDKDLFDTREISLWRDDQLVAFSWFDTGHRAIQSLIGVYDPDYRSDSLGYATLLLEVEWAITAGFQQHYAGYVLPGDDAMDYKLRAGNLEYLTHNAEWRPWTEFQDSETPTRLLNTALKQAETALVERGIRAETRLYRMFEAPAYDEGLRQCLSEPLIVECFPAQQSPNALIVTWDVDHELYRLLRCRRTTGLVRSNLDTDTPPREVELLIKGEALGLRRNPAALASDVAHLVVTD